VIRHLVCIQEAGQGQRGGLSLYENVHTDKIRPIELFALNPGMVRRL